MSEQKTKEIFNSETLSTKSLTERAILWMNKIPTKEKNSEYLCLLSPDSKFISDAFPDRKTPIEYGHMMYGAIFPSLPDFSMKFPIAFSGKNESDNKDIAVLLEIGHGTFKGAKVFNTSPTNKESNWICPWLFVFNKDKKIETIYKGFDMANVCRNFEWPPSAIK